MNKYKKVTPNQIIEIKYLYENTLLTISLLAKMYHTSWNYMFNVIHNNNIVKPKQLQKQILSIANSRNQQSKTPEERHLIGLKRWENVTPEEKKNRYNKVSTTSKQTWKMKSNEEKEQLKQINSQKHKELWANKTYEQKQSHIQSIKNCWTTDKRIIHGLKIHNAYDNQTEDEKQRRREVTRQKSIEMWKNWDSQTIYNRNKALSKSITNVWANRTDEEKQRIYTKIFNTMSKNKSFSKSKMEKELYNYLINNNVDVIWQYKCNNIWFDFRITVNNEITFVELNGSYWHNKRPFNNSKEHLEEYDCLINDDSKQHSVIAKRWRYTDPDKILYCNEHKLNYICIYYNSIKELDKVIDIINNNLNNGVNIFIL